MKATSIRQSKRDNSHKFQFLKIKNKKPNKSIKILTKKGQLFSYEVLNDRIYFNTPLSSKIDGWYS